MEEKKSKDYLGISEKRIEDLKRITTNMMNANVERVENNQFILNVTELIISLENRTDMTIKEKILCSFQMGMNAQRLLKIEKYDT